MMPNTLELDSLVFGRSEEGRDLLVEFAGDATAPNRALILAGQHGDEGIARAAARDFLRWFRESPVPGLRIAVVAELNPDGFAMKRRTNSFGVDLNRDHQKLVSAEVFALHDFTRVFRPHRILDIHSYPTRRAHLLRHGLEHCHDLFLDIPTHPALAYLLEYNPLPNLVTELQSRGYSAHRYVVRTRTGRLRHSTPDVCDARNGLAIKFAIPTLLIEGRKPRQTDDRDERRRIRSAMRNAMELAVSAPLAEPAPTAAAAVALRCRYSNSTEQCRMPFRNLRTGAIETLPIPGAYSPNVTTTRTVKLPSAYAIPSTHPELITLFLNQA